MEPLFFKAENDDLKFLSPFQVLLQWSRFFSKRKILVVVEADIPDHLLQWSRFFSKRKIFGTRRACPAPQGSGFNGAAFFQSGK